ncbi:hypothetical protein AX17_005861 [Amanita inopinata Kibby_2008]|nr:hypothetical protein AX17_005861 [Amanita inopinata Kibby_2008]
MLTSSSSFASTPKIPARPGHPTELRKANAGHTPRYSKIPRARRPTQKDATNLPPNGLNRQKENVPLPNKGKSLGKSTVVSPPSFRFGDQRMGRAKSGHFKRPSLEVNCLVAQGEDVFTCSQPVDGEQAQANADTSSWGEAEASSSRDHSHSSISCIPYPNLDAGPSAFSPLKSQCSTFKTPARVQAYTRTPGHSQRLQYSQIRTSLRSSAYGVIKEEKAAIDSPTDAITLLKISSPNVAQTWKAERNRRKSLNKYYTLRHEAENIVSESKKQWVDTPFSTSVVQNFQPPRDADAMQTLLQDSMKNYRPLPSELRHCRRGSRTYSHSYSPYARARINRLLSPEKAGGSPSPSLNRRRTSAPAKAAVRSSIVLQDISANPNVLSTPQSKQSPLKPFRRHGSPKKAIGVPAPLKNVSPVKRAAPGQPAVEPVSRRRTLGSVKSSDKENKESVNQDLNKTPGGSLRIDRARPKYRSLTPRPKRRNYRQ